MEEYYAVNDFRGYLMHYGVKGMHWGVRRYQNTDGSLTSLGRQHYGYSSNRREEGGMMDYIKRGGRKASGMLDFMKKNHKDTDKYKNASLSIEDLNKKLLNANANSMDIWKRLNKKQAGSEKEQKKKQSALNWIKKHPAETILFTAIGAVGVKRVIDLAYVGKQTYNTVKNWDNIMDTINDMEDNMQEYIRSSLNQ